MSTPSFIARVIDNNTLEGIYCHWDGNVNGVGKLLYEYYYDEQKVHDLMKLGNISFLEKELNPTSPAHSFDTPEKGVVVAYRRDRKEKRQEAVIISRKDSIIKSCPYPSIAWFYLFDEDKEWKVRSSNSTSWTYLEDAIWESGFTHF